jgi:membrane protein
VLWQAIRQIARKDFYKRLYAEYANHGVADSASSLSYYFIFSLFPFLFFLTTLAAYIPQVSRSLDPMLARARLVLPGQAMAVVETHLNGLVNQPRPRLLTLGVLVAIYSASRGVDAVRKALNRAYDVKETRPMWKTELLAFGMTIGGGLLVLVGITLLIVGSNAGFWVARHLGIGNVFVTIISWIRWPITAAVITLGAALSYYILPNVKQEFKFITPGSIIGTLVWFLSSWGFSEYVGNFGSYNATYGSIGGVIVLMTWFFITGFILIMGGEINAILESKMIGGKASGAHAPGEAAPPPEERPSHAPVGATDRASVANAHGEKKS